jgi:hypothetical protein
MHSRPICRRILQIWPALCRISKHQSQSTRQISIFSKQVRHSPQSSRWIVRTRTNQHQAVANLGSPPGSNSGYFQSKFLSFGDIKCNPSSSVNTWDGSIWLHSHSLEPDSCRKQWIAAWSKSPRFWLQGWSSHERIGGRARKQRIQQPATLQVPSQTGFSLLCLPFHRIELGLSQLSKKTQLR